MSIELTTRNIGTGEILKIGKITTAITTIPDIRLMYFDKLFLEKSDVIIPTEITALTTVLM